MANNTNSAIHLGTKTVGSTLHTNDSYDKGAYYLTESPEIYEPQRSNCFKFVVDLSGMNSQLLSDFGVTVPDSNASKTLELAVKASSVPHFNIEPITINRGNGQMKFAGKPSFKDGQISVHDYIGAHTKEILLAWQRQAYNVKTQKVGLAKDYKRTATLYELTPDFQIVRTWKMFGCWISDISDPNYDADSSDARVMDVTIVYDYAYPEVED